MGKVQASQEIFSSQLLGQRSVLRGSHSTGKKHAECLKCPYYGFLKMIFHAVCNSALNENILQSFKSESAPCIKLLSLKRDSESLKRVVFNPKPFHVDIKMKH